MRIKELEAENFELKERNHRLEKAVVNTTKRIKELEGRLESLWNKTGGIEPDCGQMWLTPRMEDDAELMAKVMKLHDRIKELEEKNERHHRIAEKFIELNRKSKVQLAKAEAKNKHILKRLNEAEKILIEQVREIAFLDKGK